MNEPRIYVACLASYNAGMLHGSWIDAAQDAVDIQEAIDVMLRLSPCPNVTVDCPECGGKGEEQFQPAISSTVQNVEDLQSNNVHEWETRPCSHCKGSGKVPSAEEWAIHDYEGFGEIKLGENPSLETVEYLADLIVHHEEAFIAFYDNGNCDGLEPHEWEDAFTENYAGSYDSLADYAEEMMSDCYNLKEIPGNLGSYIDWEKLGKDMELGGDVWSISNGEGGVFIFRNT